MKSPSHSIGLNPLVQEYHSHLINEAGLAPETCAQRVRYAIRFLHAYGSGTRLSLRRLNAGWLRRYILDLSAHCVPRTLRCQAGAVRSFLGYLVLTGHLSAGLEQAVPAIRAPHQRLRAYLSRAQLRQLFRGFDPKRSADTRDYAITLLAAKLGLRAKEIAQLGLSDLDWRAGTVALHQTKSRRSRVLPLPGMVGAALAKYLSRVRAHSPARSVFLCLNRAKSLSADGVSSAIRAGFKRAGLDASRPGARLLRHTLATHLVQKGATLKAIADVLGHRSINTTSVYTTVDLPMLAHLAQPWPEEAL